MSLKHIRIINSKTFVEETTASVGFMLFSAVEFWSLVSDLELCYDIFKYSLLFFNGTYRILFYVSPSYLY